MDASARIMERRIMSRIIDADTLMKDICDSLNQMTNIGIAVDGDWLWAKLNDAIDNAPTIESEQMWIPVSERLPEIGEHYVSDPCIVYCSNGAYGFAELEENIFGQVGWNCERDDEYHEPLGEVLAWMPLPEPYKGESEDDKE